jgi:hypothetical protein
MGEGSMSLYIRIPQIDMAKLTVKEVVTLIDEWFTDPEYKNHRAKVYGFKDYQDGTPVYEIMEWGSASHGRYPGDPWPEWVKEPADNFRWQAELVCGTESWVLHINVIRPDKTRRWCGDMVYPVWSIKMFDDDVLWELLRALTMCLNDQAYAYPGLCRTFELTWHSDPGHAWLEVPNWLWHGFPVEERESLQASISQCSYMDADRTFLEEDCDAPKFIGALEKKGHTVVFKEHHVNGPSVIRNLKSFAC